MAVAKNDSGTNNTQNVTATSIDLSTFTVSAGSNLILVGFLMTGDGITNVSMTWDNGGTNQAMTSAGSAQQTSRGRVECFYLINPTTGNKTLHAAWTTSTNALIGAIAFSGADQTTGINASDTILNNTGNSSSPSITVTSTTDGATIAGVVTTAQDLTATNTQTEFFRSQSRGSGGSYGLGGSSNTHSWTLSGSTQWSAVGIHVLAAGGGGGDTLFGMCLT